MTDYLWQDASQFARSDEIRFLLVSGARDGLISTWGQQLGAVDDFVSIATATTVSEFFQRLEGYAPEVVLISGYVASNQQEFEELLVKISNAAIYVCLPSGLEQQSNLDAILLRIKQIRNVRGVWLDGKMPSIADLASTIHSDVEQLRNKAPQISSTWQNGGGRQQYLGTKIITIWNRCGGCGKSTVALAIAQSLALRKTRTLLAELSVPGSLPIKLGKPWTPGFSTWFEQRTPEGLRASVQSVQSNLDVMMAPRTIAQERNFFSPDHEPLEMFKNQAVMAQYAAILLDAPVSGQVRGAIRASNSLVLVSRATLEDAAATAAAYAYVMRSEAGQHAITPDNIFLLINQDGDGSINEKDYVGALRCPLFPNPR